jgi:uncharacterized Zn finger protein
MGIIAVTEASVRRIADPLSYDRGELYATQGRVRDLTVSGRTIRATSMAPIRPTSLWLSPRTD